MSNDERLTGEQKAKTDDDDNQRIQSEFNAWNELLDFQQKDGIITAVQAALIKKTFPQNDRIFEYDDDGEPIPQSMLIEEIYEMLKTDPTKRNEQAEIVGELSVEGENVEPSIFQTGNRLLLQTGHWEKENHGKYLEAPYKGADILIIISDIPRDEFPEPPMWKGMVATTITWNRHHKVQIITLEKRPFMMAQF